MKISTGMKKALSVIATIAVAFVLFFAVERPWFMGWGASQDEQNAALPGDGFASGAALQSTRAVTILAPIDRVWPWVAQLGQDRGGFYSYEILEDLVGCEMPNTSRIMPEHQTWKSGDKLWMYPPSKLDGLGGAPLVAYRPGQYLVFATRRIGAPPSAREDGTWGFYLEPAGEHSTRLIVRGRGAGGVSGLAAVIHFGIFEPVHFVMERRMMSNIKVLAEGRRTSVASEVASVGLWTLTVALMIASVVAVARRRRWARPLAVGAATVLAFQFLTLLQPSPVLASTVVVALGLALWWNAGDRPGTHAPAVTIDQRPVWVSALLCP